MEIQVSRQMAVSPARVMRALTERVEVAQWAGAELELDAETYRLTGTSIVLGALGGRLIERTATTIRFEWVIREQVTEVEIQIKQEPQAGNRPAIGSEVTLVHRGIPTGVFSLHEKPTWECIWILLLRYLRSWVEREERPALFSFEGPFPALIEREISLAAPIEKAWRALIEPELRRRWMDEEMGPILALEEGRSVSFGWPELPGSLVTFSLESLGPMQTRLSLRHEGQANAGLTYHLGWYDYMVSCYLETAEPRTIG